MGDGRGPHGRVGEADRQVTSHGGAERSGMERGMGDGSNGEGGGCGDKVRSRIPRVLDQKRAQSQLMKP